MPRLFNPASLTGAWGILILWVLGYAALKVFVPTGLDLDSAEQVYFAQSWQMGYGTRQPPLYTWLILALKPDGASWVLALEVARYGCLLLWLAGVQMLARACGANAAVQARTLLLHLGLMLVMWRVHDSLTHTVLAACVTVWGSVAVVRALSQPVWWVLVGALGALACLAKLNGALWCASSFVAAWVVISGAQRGDLNDARGDTRRHLLWMLVALVVFLALLAPYGLWWLSRPSGSVDLARRIVVADEGRPVWWPAAQVLLGSIEYTLLGPFLIAITAWALRSRTSVAATELNASAGMRWMAWQSGLAMLLLVAMLVAMKGSHFTPRWVWPVAPGVTVWLCVWALQRIDAMPEQQALGRRIANALCTVLPVLAVALVGVRVWEPAYNAARCNNCWTDRPADTLSFVLHQAHGQGPLRVITGDDHLGGILVQASASDRVWTSSSRDLPPPEGFASARMPCVAAWMNVDEPRPAPADLQRIVGSDVNLTKARPVGLPMARAPQRRFWLQSLALPASVCARAPL